MEVKDFDSLYEELSNAIRRGKYAKQNFGYFIKHASSFIAGPLGLRLELSCEEKGGALIIKSPIAEVRIAYAAIVEAEGVRSSLVVHRLPSDPAFQEATLVAEISVEPGGEAALKINGQALNVTVDTHAMCLVIHLLQVAARTPLAFRMASTATSD